MPTISNPFGSRQSNKFMLEIWLVKIQGTSSLNSKPSTSSLSEDFNNLGQAAFECRDWSGSGRSVVYMWCISVFFTLLVHLYECCVLFRSFAGINPSRGTKTERHRGKSHCIHPKLLKLSNELRDFTNQWAI